MSSAIRTNNGSTKSAGALLGDPHLMPDGTFFRAGYAPRKYGKPRFEIQTTVTNAAILLGRFADENSGTFEAYYRTNQLIDLVRSSSRPENLIDMVTRQREIRLSGGLRIKFSPGPISASGNFEELVVMSLFPPKGIRSPNSEFEKDCLEVIAAHRQERGYIRNYRLEAEPTLIGISDALRSILSYLRIVPVRGMYHIDPGTAMPVHDLSYLLRKNGEIDRGAFGLPSSRTPSRVAASVMSDWDDVWAVSLSFMYASDVLRMLQIVGRPVAYDRRPLTPMKWSILNPPGSAPEIEEGEIAKILNSIFRGSHSLAAAPGTPAIPETHGGAQPPISSAGQAVSALSAAAAAQTAIISAISAFACLTPLAL